MSECLLLFVFVFVFVFYIAIVVIAVTAPWWRFGVYAIFRASVNERITAECTSMLWFLCRCAIAAMRLFGFA